MQMEITYKTSGLSGEDLKKISLCEAEHFSDACSCETLHTLAESGAIFTAAFDGDAICGFAYVSVAPFEAELLRIAVSREYRGRGIAKKLLSLLSESAINAGCEDIFLEVRESNASAIALYESCGYVKTGMRKGFYKNPREDALLYKKSLTNGREDL